MLQTAQLSGPEALSFDTAEKKLSIPDSIMSKDTRVDGAELSTQKGGSDAGAGSPSPASNKIHWEEVKKARNRINSQRTRERERSQIKTLEAERARLWLSNDAIKFQNRHFREVIAKILEVRDLKRMRMAANGGPATSSSGLFVGAGPLGGGSSLGMMGGLGVGLDGDLFQSSRRSATAKDFGGLSNADLLARHQANSIEMQSMMRQQEAMDRLGAGGLNLSLINGRMGGGPTLGMNMNGMNMNSAYSDISDNARIRQLMLQHSAAGGGDFEPKGFLSSFGGSDGVNGNGIGNNNEGDASNGNGNINGISLSGAPGGMGGMGDIGGISDADILQMTKRQKLGY